MITTPAIHTVSTNKLSKKDFDFIWGNMIIEKRISLSWLEKFVQKIAKITLMYHFWKVFTSPVS